MYINGKEVLGVRVKFKSREYSFTDQELELCNARGDTVGRGRVTAQQSVHGRELTVGWIPLMVLDIQPDIRPWDEFPTQSGEVEKGSFIAWPKVFLKPTVKNS